MVMDRQHVVLVLLLDLSAAFDTVDHSVLLLRISTSFGIRGTSQRVSLDGNFSQAFPLKQGVPQGSCLAPLLFTLYASKLSEIVKRHLPEAHANADDTDLYVAFKPDTAANTESAFAAVELCVQDIRAWMLCDKLKINYGKTDLILIGTRQQLLKVHVNSLAVGDVRVSSVTSVRTLALGWIAI
jgi:hypothetical protein